mmetsp:Transcript_42819/g.99441  ORF Transcript_42819/g.99441 Transcript_42819/m.99441 type:complete len:241 (+) Transcript_42819:340-1062(+)
MPRMTLDSSRLKCCPMQLRGPLMKGRKAHWSTSPSPVSGEVDAATPNRPGLNLSTSPPGQESAVWCTPRMLHMTTTPLGIRVPPISSSSASSLVTTGTTEWMRSVSRSTLNVCISDILMKPNSALWPFLKTSCASLAHSSMSLGEFISSHRAHVRVADVVSCPAKRKVLSPSRSSLSVDVVILPSIPARIRSRMSRGTPSYPPPSNLERHLPMTCPSRNLLSLETRARWRHQSGRGRKLR